MPKYITESSYLKHLHFLQRAVSQMKCFKGFAGTRGRDIRLRSKGSVSCKNILFDVKSCWHVVTLVYLSNVNNSISQFPTLTYQLLLHKHLLLC